MNLKHQNLSQYQLFIAVVFLNISTAIFFAPSELGFIAKQDAWLPIILGITIEILIGIYPLADLGMRFPKETFIQYSTKVCGKYGGKFIGLLLIFWCFQTQCWTLREFGETSAHLLPETPVMVIMTLLSLLIIFSVYNGIEVIVRCGEFVFPIGLFFLLIVALVNAPSMNVSNLQPAVQTDVPTLIRGSISVVDWLSTSFGFAILTGFINKPQKLKRVGILAISVSGALLLFFTVTNLMIFGPGLLARINFPLLSLSEYGVQGAEAFVIAAWFSWIFIRASLLCYITVFGLSQLFQLSDYKFLILPEAVLAIVYSTHQYKSLSEMSNDFSTNHLFFMIFQLGLPLVVWLFALARKSNSISANAGKKN